MFSHRSQTRWRSACDRCWHARVAGARELPICGLESGSYASNLKVDFNLLTIEPGTVVLEKRLPDNVQSAYADVAFAYQIFTVENGVKKLYEPPAGKSVTYEDTGNGVVPSGRTESAGFKPSYTIGGKECKNVYFLKPGEAIALPMTDGKVQYYVIDISIDTDVYERVNINDVEAQITMTDSVGSENLDPTYLAATSVDTVQSRGRVTYENVPKPDQVRNLRLTKVIDTMVPVGEPAPQFRFDVQLESSATGQLTPYSQGLYYIVKTDADGVDHYCKYEGGKLVASDTPVAYTSGVNGAIDSIEEGYTILIKDLLAGTDFNVVESAKEMPEGYTYVKTDVEHAEERNILPTRDRCAVRIQPAFLPDQDDGVEDGDNAASRISRDGAVFESAVGQCREHVRSAE